MLVIRLQRTGRKGHAQFRIVVQDSRRTPTSGKVVAALGSYNPHTKTVVLDKEKAQTYLNNGAQPSNRAVSILQAEGIKLPSWVKTAAATKQRDVRNPEKRRSTSPAEPEAPADEAPANDDAEPVADAPAAAEEATEAPAEVVVEAPAEEHTEAET